MNKMIKINLLSKIFISYIFLYLIIPGSAICNNLNNKFFLNIENNLNNRNFDALDKYFDNKEKIKFENKLRKIVNEFPDLKWLIKESNSKNNQKQVLDINLTGTKFINGKKFILDSNFNFLFHFNNGKIKDSSITNHLTTIRNDKNSIDLNISIPNKVLTGSNYNLDIILNEPLDEIMIAGGIKEYQIDTFFDQKVILEPLPTGGIFKVTRAPLNPGTQIWTGLIAHPRGIISFTKSVDIVDKLN